MKKRLISTLLVAAMARRLTNYCQLKNLDEVDK